MQIKLQINKQITQLEQMAKHFNIAPIDNRLEIPKSLGKGFVQYYELPYDIQVHHYQYNLSQRIEVQGQNEIDNGLYMININLSNRILQKEIGDQAVNMSKSGGSGTFFYSPGYHSKGHNDLNVDFEVVFFAFPKSTLNLLGTSDFLVGLSALEKFCIYDELNDQNEKDLKSALQLNPQKLNKMVINGKLLSVVGSIIEQFAIRKEKPSTKLNLVDIERQFKVKEVLLSHIYGNPPNLQTLAEMVHISPTKLKTDFKSIFGKSVYQYYLARKMEVAKTLIQENKNTITEIGYQLGYSNISQFSAQFKKQFGMNPSKLQ